VPVDRESGAIESGVGARLSRARTERNLSIEELAWRLRIRPELLRALEADAFDELGHHGHIRTHLRSYARTLGLDSGEILRAYRSLHEPDDQSPLTALDEKDRAARKHGPRSRWLRAAVVASILLIAGSVLGVLKGPGGDATPASRPSARVQQASRAVKPLSQAEDAVAVRIAAKAATGVRVIVDGKIVFDQILSPGASQLFGGDRLIHVIVVDASAVSIWANDLPLAAPAGRFEAFVGRHGIVGGRHPLE